MNDDQVYDYGNKYVTIGKNPRRNEDGTICEPAIYLPETSNNTEPTGNDQLLIWKHPREIVKAGFYIFGSYNPENLKGNLFFTPQTNFELIEVKEDMNHGKPGSGDGGNCKFYTADQFDEHGNLFGGALSVALNSSWKMVLGPLPEPPRLDPETAVYVGY